MMSISSNRSGLPTVPAIFHRAIYETLNTNHGLIWYQAERFLQWERKKGFTTDFVGLHELQRDISTVVRLQSDFRPTMADRSKRTRFARHISRCLFEDEVLVLQHLSRHIKYCAKCDVSEPNRGRVHLCARGYDYLRDMDQYLYLQHGSQVDHGCSKVMVPEQFHGLLGLLLTRLECLPTKTQRLSRKTLPSRVVQNSSSHKSPSTSATKRYLQTRAKHPGHHQKDVAPSIYTDDFVILYAEIAPIMLPLRIRRRDLDRVQAFRGFDT